MAPMNRAALADRWTGEIIQAWTNAQDPTTHDVKLSHPLDKYAVLVYNDASDEF